MKTYSVLAIVMITFAAAAFALPIQSDGETAELLDTALPDSIESNGETAELLDTALPDSTLATVQSAIAELQHHESVKKSGNCPAGYTVYEAHTENNHGDVCRISSTNKGWTCPTGCTKVSHAAPWCKRGNELCRNPKCWRKMPTGCARTLSEPGSQGTGLNWFIDPHSPNSAKCTARIAAYNNYCGKSDAMTKWGSKPTSGNCPAGYTVYEAHTEDNHGDVCRISSTNKGWTCPIGCTKVSHAAPWCKRGNKLCRKTQGGHQRTRSVRESALMRWAVAMLGMKNVKHCWKQSYGNGVGTPLKCPPGKSKEAALCYTPCKPGFRGVATRCYRNCPHGYRDDGLYCAKPKPYGRGAGYALIWGGPRKCLAASGGRGCERWGALLYPKCAKGYHNVGCCICSPNCPYGKDIGVSCEKIWYDRGVGKSLVSHGVCSPWDYRKASLCYKKCQRGFYGNGPVCWGGCPAMQPVECAAGCARTKGECGSAILDMIKAVFKFLADILSQFMDGGFLTSVKKGLEQAASAVQKVQKGISAVQKVVDGINAMQQANKNMQQSPEAAKLKARLRRGGYSAEVTNRVVDQAFAAFAEGGVFGDGRHPNPNWQMTPSLLDQMDTKVSGAIRGLGLSKLIKGAKGVFGKVKGAIGFFKNFESGFSGITDKFSKGFEGGGGSLAGIGKMVPGLDGKLKGLSGKFKKFKNTISGFKGVKTGFHDMGKMEGIVGNFKNSIASFEGQCVKSLKAKGLKARGMMASLKGKFRTLKDGVSNIGGEFLGGIKAENNRFDRFKERLLEIEGKNEAEASDEDNKGISDVFGKLEDAVDNTPSQLLGVVVEKVPFAGSLFKLFKAFDQPKCPLDVLPESCAEDPGVCGTGQCAYKGKEADRFRCICPPGTLQPDCAKPKPVEEQLEALEGVRVGNNTSALVAGNETMLKTENPKLHAALEGVFDALRKAQRVAAEQAPGNKMLVSEEEMLELARRSHVTDLLEFKPLGLPAHTV